MYSQKLILIAKNVIAADFKLTKTHNQIVAKT